jgi:hypothetical protein
VLNLDVRGETMLNINANEHDATPENVPLAGEDGNTLTEEQQAANDDEAPIEQADPEVGTEE